MNFFPLVDLSAWFFLPQGADTDVSYMDQLDFDSPTGAASCVVFSW